MNPKAILGALVSPWAVALLVSATLLFSHGYAYNRGKSRAELACNTAALQSQIDALKRDLAVAQASERIASRLQEQAEAREQVLKERLTDYELSIEGSEPDVCLLGPADVDGLRGLVR